MFGRRFVLLVALLGATAWTAGCPMPHTFKGAPVIVQEKVVDLSYSFGPDTIYWPTGESFALQRTHFGRTPDGYWYASNNICMAEHGGTHMDAPIHFGEGKNTADQVPLSDCIGPAAVIDVRDKVAADRDYRLSVEDIAAWEGQHGRLPKGAIVVMYSGWGTRWGNKLAYLGTDKAGDVANLHFPGFSRQAAELLVAQREIAAIGVDTASIDHGPSHDFPVHRVINGANKPAFENVANVERLPPAGATLIALPMKIAGGSGGPTRIIALLP
ncbi:MAG: cyclase family protein [Deltaproteobacteria bacterium]|nr:cyclase family protein [Deltaproteobacteria bacterium]